MDMFSYLRQDAMLFVVIVIEIVVVFNAFNVKMLLFPIVTVTVAFV